MHPYLQEAICRAMEDYGYNPATFGAGIADKIEARFREHPDLLKKPLRELLDA